METDAMTASMSISVMNQFLNKVGIGIAPLREHFVNESFYHFNVFALANGTKMTNLYVRCIEESYVYSDLFECPTISELEDGFLLLIIARRNSEPMACIFAPFEAAEADKIEVLSRMQSQFACSKTLRNICLCL
ncbi:MULTISPECIES: hypothetical protein [unclassified Pseudoalteromonas]|uniref:hypothetical protein n=1 Tax=unclassified Pseudoalteromonas TaxID=194690 RepID=UPI001F3231EE|nr:MULTISPECIES: hypothetical protein [unclassified Pseudoalteromonas]MCF2829724.1 hypothetical protein [Pseudoalteromonas sp. OF5H-5]MCF2832592.1 hypothetical protein [Pseudoalteromonas sp. DL2-H6]MCF2927614.1 hypothetical protein [Pseudoalteromonas sp. DL2-H1]